MRHARRLDRRTPGSATRATALARGFAAAADADDPPGLRVLQLGFNSIGVEGIEALVEAHAAGAPSTNSSIWTSRVT